MIVTVHLTIRTYQSFVSFLSGDMKASINEEITRRDVFMNIPCFIIQVQVLSRL